MDDWMNNTYCYPLSLCNETEYYAENKSTREGTNKCTDVFVVVEIVVVVVVFVVVMVAVVVVVVIIILLCLALLDVEVVVVIVVIVVSVVGWWGYGSRWWW